MTMTSPGTMGTLGQFGGLDGLAPDPDLTLSFDPAAEPLVEDPTAEILRPNGEIYQPRMLANGMTDIQFLRKARAGGLHQRMFVLLGGPPGCGKTAGVEAAFGDDLITFQGTGESEVADLKGAWSKVSGEYIWTDGPLIRAMKEGKVLLLDEVTRPEARVIATVYPAMDGRAAVTLTEHLGETIVAKDGFWVVGAYNPDLPGTALDEPLQSRFTLPISVSTDYTVATKLGVDRRMVNAATEMDEKRRDDDVDEVFWAPQMRELLAFQTNVRTFGEEVALGALVGGAPEEQRSELIDALKTHWPDRLHGAIKPLSLEA
jgi:MoxR-like ATPase